jgi:hypothetical protein
MEINFDTFKGQYYNQNVGVRYVETGSTEKKSCLTQDGHMLSLKSLFSITKKDTIEVGRIKGYKGENKFIEGRGIIHRLRTLYHKHEIPFTAVDYLRSKGYALPWMGISVDEMVEREWITLDSKL